MGIITIINNVPLFSTINEAEIWAAASGLSGYHTHSFNGQQGYMGGANHQQATGMPLNTNAPSVTTGGSSTGGSSGGGY